jgi:hypothetical protein
MNSIEILEKLKRKIDSAYQERLIKGKKDYPPYKLMVWDDRSAYHAFILILIDELVEEEKKEQMKT